MIKPAVVFFLLTCVWKLQAEETVVVALEAGAAEAEGEGSVAGEAGAASVEGKLLGTEEREGSSRRTPTWATELGSISGTMRMERSWPRESGLRT